MVAAPNCEHIMEDLAGSDKVIGRRMLTEALDWRAAAQPNKTFCFVKKSLDKEDRWMALSYKQIADAVNRMAWWIHRTLGPAHTRETLGYMANNDVRYIIFCLGAVKAGYTALLSSPRNSIEGHLHLLRTLGSNKFFWSAERYTKVALIQEVMPNLITWEVPSLEALLEGPCEPFPHNMSFAKNIDDVAIYVHSSGSTGLPKPVRITNGYFAALDAHSILPPSLDGRRTIMGTINVDDRTFCMLPFFHLSGFFAFSESIWRQLPFAICPDKSPSTEQIVDMILDIQATRATFLPSLIEGIIRSDRGAQVIRQLRELHYGGAPLPPSIGDNLCKLTKVISGYGATEMGNVAGLMPKDPEDWNCCEWHPEMGIKMEEVDKSGLFEFVMYRKEDRTFQCTFHAFPDLQVYRSNDLFSKHPTKPDRWIFQGRRDDVIVLNNGEKFNPSLMEDTITRDPRVRAAIIVGHGRFQSALIVDPNYEMWTEDLDESSFIDRIWPSVVDANKVGPTHATVTKPMILLASKSKPFVITGKGTIQRKKILEEYGEDIDRLYAQDGVEEIGDLAPVATLEQMQLYVRNALATVLENPDLTNSSDIFDSGADSLHIIRLSTALQTAVQKAHPDKDYLSINAQQMYSRRTISQIAQFLLSVVNDDSSTEAAPETEEMRVGRMQRVAEKYIQDLPMKHTDMPPFPQTYDVILTGSTGSLGSYLLHQLLHQDNVATIYCLNRSDDALARQKQSFEDKGLEWGDRSTKVMFWQARYGDENLGLSKERYEELLSSVAVVIHNAWKVDFNHVLDTFEYDHVRGVRRFVDFSLASHHRAHICFVSSISSVGRWDDSLVPHVPERPLWDPRIATKSGYGESKHVAERILTEAASHAGVPASILRVAQVSGPTTSQGEWNRTEWLPAIVLSSRALGLIPDSLQNMTVDWIPVDLLARIITELVHSSLGSRQERRLSVFHLVNPTVVPWGLLIPTIQKRFPAEQVSFPAWIDSLSRVQPSKETIAKVPALKLLDFFRGNASSSEKLPLLDLVQTRQASSTLRELKGVDIALMDNYLNQWGL